MDMRKQDVVHILQEQLSTNASMQHTSRVCLTTCDLQDLETERNMADAAQRQLRDLDRNSTIQASGQHCADNSGLCLSPMLACVQATADRHPCRVSVPCDADLATIH